MSDKFASMLKILNRIDAGEPVTVNSLRNELEISERTVHRYMDDLRVGGFPILFDKQSGTYRFAEKYHLKRINLSVEEMLTIALAKNMLKNAGSGMEDSLNSIESKLANKKTDLPKHIIFSTPTFTEETSAHFEKLNTAITENSRIEMEYHPLHEKKKSERKVDPQYLFFHDGFWYMRGYCHYVEGDRTFALDRIRSINVLDEHFIPKRKSPEDELAMSFGAWVDGEPTEVVVRIDPMLREAVLRKKWIKNQTEKDLEDGSVELTFQVKGFGGIKRWIYGWLPFIEVIRPKDLRDEVRDALKEAARRNR